MKSLEIREVIPKQKREDSDSMSIEPTPVTMNRPSASGSPSKITTLLAEYRNRAYVLYEKAWAILRPGPSLRILFSDYPGYEEDLRYGFARLRHTVEFGTISPQSLAEYDLVIPLFLSELLDVSRDSQSSLENPIPFPSDECILLCDDKLRLNQKLIDEGFGRHIPETNDEIVPPYILKKRHTLYGRESWVIRDRHDEVKVFAQLNDPSFFRQRIVSGRREFATHILFSEQKIVKSLTIMYEFEKDTAILGQQYPLYSVIHRCPHLDLFANILKRIGFQGLCCIDYKVSDGTPYIFEINPRFGGSLATYFFSFVRHLNLRSHSFGKDPKQQSIGSDYSGTGFK